MMLLSYNLYVIAVITLQQNDLYTFTQSTVRPCIRLDKVAFGMFSTVETKYVAVLTSDQAIIFKFASVVVYVSLNGSISICLVVALHNTSMMRACVLCKNSFKLGAFSSEKT